MDGWTESTAHPGYMAKVVQVGSNTVIIHRPILDATERALREKHVREALETILRDYYFKSTQRKETA